MGKEEQEEGYCNHCGAKIKKYTYSLTPALADVLIEIHKIVHKKDSNKVSMKELREHLKTYQYTQLSKLRFLGLIFKNLDSDGKFTGEWGITARGGGFLRGELQVPKRVTTFRNRVQHDETEDVEHVTIKQVYSGEAPYIEGLADVVYNSNIATEGQQATASVEKAVELPRTKYEAIVVSHHDKAIIGSIVVIEIEKVQIYKPVVVYLNGSRYQFAHSASIAKKFKILRRIDSE